MGSSPIRITKRDYDIIGIEVNKYAQTVNVYIPININPHNR